MEQKWVWIKKVIFLDYYIPIQVIATICLDFISPIIPNNSTEQHYFPIYFS